MPTENHLRFPCQRCRRTVDDPTLIRDTPLWTGKYNYTVTLCRTCYDEAYALMQEYPDAPQVILWRHGVQPYDTDYEDFVQWLNQNYWICAIEFKKELGIKFSTYSLDSLYEAAKSCLRRAHAHGFVGLTRLLNSGARLDRPASISADNEEDEGEGPRALIEYDLAEELDWAELRQKVWDAIERLPEVESLIVRRSHFDGWSLKKIGAELGIPVDRLRKLKLHAETKLACELENAVP